MNKFYFDGPSKIGRYAAQRVRNSQSRKLLGYAVQYGSRGWRPVDADGNYLGLDVFKTATEAAEQLKEA